MPIFNIPTVNIFQTNHTKFLRFNSIFFGHGFNGYISTGFGHLLCDLNIFKLKSVREKYCASKKIYLTAIDSSHFTRGHQPVDRIVIDRRRILAHNEGNLIQIDALCACVCVH